MVETEALSILRTMLESHLREAFPGYEVDADGDFVVRPGEATVWIRPSEWTDGLTIVRVWSITTVDVQVDGELTRFLATENAKLVFGRFQLDEDRPAVVFSHSLLGDFLNRKELEAAVAAVAATSDAYRGQIKARFGGRVFGEVAPVGGPTRPAQGGAGRNVKAWQAAFSLLAVVAAVPAAIYAYRFAESIWLSLFVALLVLQLVGRGACDVMTDPNKIRRALYFLLFPVLATGILWGCYEAWGKWWLAVVVGTAGGVLLSAVLAPLLFPRIHREELEDSTRRLGSTA